MQNLKTLWRKAGRYRGPLKWGTLGVFCVLVTINVAAILLWSSFINDYEWGKGYGAPLLETVGIKNLLAYYLVALGRSDFYRYLLFTCAGVFTLLSIEITKGEKALEELVVVKNHSAEPIRAMELCNHLLLVSQENGVKRVFRLMAVQKPEDIFEVAKGRHERMVKIIKNGD